MFKKAGASLVITALITITGCVSTDKDGVIADQNSSNARATSMKALSLTIKSPVQSGIPYPALMTCTLPAGGADIIGGYFFWNEEGPFEYPVEKYSLVHDRSQGQYVVLKFMLFTGRASTYTISGCVRYRDKATGLNGTTERVSAGAVRVR